MDQELVAMVHKVLGNEPVTTSKATELLEEYFQYRCPDDLVRTLNRLKKEGYVRGKISMEHGGWIWWTDEGCKGE